jgi:hypothetical protein
MGFLGLRNTGGIIIICITVIRIGWGSSYLVDACLVARVGDQRRVGGEDNTLGHTLRLCVEFAVGQFVECMQRNHVCADVLEVSFGVDDEVG